MARAGVSGTRWTEVAGCTGEITVSVGDSPDSMTGVIGSEPGCVAPVSPSAEAMMVAIVGLGQEDSSSSASESSKGRVGLGHDG